MNEMIAEVFGNFYIYLFVFVRMAGMLLFNPFLSRRNMPSRVKVVLILALTMAIAPNVSAEAVEITQGAALLMGVLRELFLGVTSGYVFSLFYYMLFYAGDIADQQMGMSMAKVFDPNTQIQMSITGNILNLMLLLYFFITDTHLLVIKLFAYSFELIPAGAANITFTAVTTVYVDMFLTVMMMVLQLAAPIVAVIFISDVAMGILMKLIPQIHVFVINMQFKALAGMLLLMVLMVPISDFISRYTGFCFESVQTIMLALIK